MRLIIAGSSHLNLTSDYIDETLRLFGIDKSKITEIVSGNAPGVDYAGEEFTIDYLNKEPKTFPADWSRGLSAGHARNSQMADYADELLLIWDGKSEGSADMKTEMMKRRKPIHEVIIKCS